MAEVRFKKIFVSIDAFGEVVGGALLARAGGEGRTVLALVNDHAEFIADVEPDLGIMSETDGVDVLRLEKPNVSLGERAGLTGGRRDAAARRINGKTAEKDWATVEMKLTIAAFEGTKAKADGLLRECLAGLGCR